MAAAYGPWADLHTEVLLTIAVGYSLKDYVYLRSVCTAWRSALALPVPPAPLLRPLVVLADGHRDSALPLLTQHPLHLSTDTSDSGSRFTVPPCHRRNDIVGSSNGWLAVASDLMGSSIWTVGIFLVNPHTGEEIKLLPPRSARYLRKIVFAPNPRPHDCTAAAITDLREVAYTNHCRDMEWTIIDIAMDGLEELAYDAQGNKVYCLGPRGEVRVLHIPRGRMQKPTVEPLLAGNAGLRFNPAAVFAPPFDIVSGLTFAKYLFLYDGSLYQVWQNISSTVRLPLQAGCSRFTMSPDEIFVLKYDSECNPCWDVVKDLGGCSSARTARVVVQAEAFPGVRGNCVYWIDYWFRVPMVCDMATGTSKPLDLPSDVCQGSGWYFCDELGDNVRKFGDDYGRTPKSCRAATVKKLKIESC